MSLRVAAYCRVSTEGAEQGGSLRSQQRFFSDYIRSREGWALAQVYADEGISGTGTRRRTAFNRMLEDARAGAIDLILTKEVSRFARNTVDALSYTRLLSSLGVGVFFLSDNIDTRDGDGELRLTLMAGIAQEESRKTSQRVKWGQKRRMEQGVVFGNNTTYGFETKHGALTIRADEAAVVRRIFCKYADEGKGTHVIARELMAEGVLPPRAEQWSPAMVRRVLRNEKYVGDLVQKKSVTVDYLTHQRQENRGREAQVSLENHHPAVVERALWNRAKAELARRSPEKTQGAGYSNRYWCSGKVFCGVCGARFVPKSRKGTDGITRRVWTCGTRARSGPTAGCAMRNLPESELDALAQGALNRLGIDFTHIGTALIAEIAALQTAAFPVQEAPTQSRRRAELTRKLEKSLDAYMGGIITAEELAALREKYSCALDALPPPQAVRERPSTAEDCAPLLAHPTQCPSVWRAVIARITVFPAQEEISFTVPA